MSAHVITSVVSKGNALRLHPLRKLIPAQVFGILYGIKMPVVFDLVEDGTLYPCFNLATRADGKRKIHLWRPVIESYEPGQIAPRSDLAQVIASILPPLGIAPASAVTLRGSELCFRWCCSYPRVIDLVRAGALREVGRHNRISESPRISYTSAAQFLASRVL